MNEFNQIKIYLAVMTLIIVFCSWVCVSYKVFKYGITPSEAKQLLIYWIFTSLAFSIALTILDK